MQRKYGWRTPGRRLARRLVTKEDTDANNGADQPDGTAAGREVGLRPAEGAAGGTDEPDAEGHGKRGADADPGGDRPDKARPPAPGREESGGVAGDADGGRTAGIPRLRRR